MRKITLPILLCTAFAIPTLTQAASPMNPGLWEISTQSDAMKNRPQISPAQAAQMRQMGMNVPEMRNGAMVMKACITKETLSRNEPPGDRKDRECQTKNAKWNGGSYSADVVCSGSNMKGNGTVNGTYSPTSFESTYRFKGTAVGQPTNHQLKTSGTWLGANCGNIKPISGTRN